VSDAAVYAAAYALALAPGLPLGFALFGRRHPAGWVAGGLLGYVLTALALWAPIRLGIPSLFTFVVAWAIAAALAWVASGEFAAPLLRLPPWTGPDTRALGCVLLLTLAIAVPPLARAGSTDAQGNRLYRAYFTADFAWHTALASELAKFSSPPRNPYLAPRPIHYYWTYFLLPGAAAGALGGGTGHVETYLKVNAVGTAVLFTCAIFLCAWSALPRAWPVASGVAMAILAPSAEGTLALWRFWQRGVPLSEVRNLNIDALANWWPPHGLRIDGLQRCFWWVPQHSMAYALGLIALTVVSAAGSAAPIGAIVLSGVALGGATLMNPFVGGVFSIVWGLAVTIDALRSGDALKKFLRHSIAAVPVALAVGWCAANQMVEGAGSALQFGWLGEARNAPVWSLLLSLGPALVAVGAGLLLQPRKLSVPALLLVAMSVLLMYFVRLDVDRSWVGFRAGQMFLAAAPALVAAALAATGASRRFGIAVVALAFLAGVPTTLIDAYNAQDVTNFAPSPNGPWTVTITPDEQSGLEWLRRTTPPDAIVQMDPLARERSTWSLIPSLAQRRMAAGRPISLLGGTQDDSEYGTKSARVRTMYATADPKQASDIARGMRIDYIWIDRTERAAYPEGAAKFDRSGELFSREFQNGEVSVYRVR
jgi:hypothetical protein